MKSQSTESRTLRQVQDSLRAQLGDVESMARVHRVAEAAARVPRDSLIAQELVADVIGETYGGTLFWDPDQVRPATHLINEVRRRARRSRRQQAIFVPLETLRESEAPHVSEPYSSGDDRGPEVDPAEQPHRLSRLRARAAGDSHVLQLLAPSERGPIRRRDALQLGMSAAEYRAARRRLMRFASEVLAATPGTRAEHPVYRSAPEAMSATQPEHDVYRSADPMSAIGLLLAATRFGPRRAEPSTATDDRDRRSA